MRIHAWYVAAALVPFALTSAPAAADWPERPIMAAAGWAAGGASDIVTRALAREMEEHLGQRITVTNITGALGSIGAQSVYDSPPDGYSWFGGAAVHGTWPVLGHADISWTEFYPFVAVVFPTTIYVRDDAPWQTLEELIADIEAGAAGSFSYGHPGAGSNGEIFASLVLEAAGVADKVDSIPYSGGREAGQFLVTGEIAFASVTMGDVTDWAVEGSIRPIANLYPEEIEFEGVTFPPVTAVYPELEPFAAINPYFGIYLHRETPEDVVVRVAEAFAHAVQQERFAQIAVHERAGVLDPAFGPAGDEILARVESARGWPLYETGVAPNNPADFEIPRVDAFTWPPHERAAKARPWPAAVEAIYEDMRAALAN